MNTEDKSIEKKLFYLIFHHLSNDGISKKINSQISALKKLGVDVTSSYLDIDKRGNYNSRVTDKNEVIEQYNNSLFIPRKWKWRFKYRRLLQYIENNDFTIVYIRYTHFASPFFNQFLKELKKKNIMILLEIPTFPYDLEYQNVSILMRFNKQIEKIYRQRFSHFINFIVTYSNEEKIFGVNTIKINNGITANDIPLRTPNVIKDEIHLLAVASMQFWHGYDRMIKGLNNYYSKINEIKVFFHLIGDSNNSESRYYRDLVQKYKLEKYIKFHGYLDGHELDRYFDISDLALGCLGVHRKGISFVKSLKNAEYCARGIPFAYSENDYTFDDQNFILKLPSNDTPIDIFKLIAFSKSHQFDPMEIRRYAINTLTWISQMKTILNRI